LHDGTKLFYQHDIHIRCECIVLFLRNMFKFRGYTQHPEICATSKEIMLFHDNVLSCCDLLAVSTNHPLSALMAMLWLTGKLGTYES
jgi:hypothetical protein